MSTLMREYRMFFEQQPLRVKSGRTGRRRRRHVRQQQRVAHMAQSARGRSTCYLVATVRRDGALFGVSTFSEAHPTICQRDCVSVLIGKWSAVGYYGVAERRAIKAIRQDSALSWVWPWVNPRRKARLGRIKLFERARNGEIAALPDVACKAAEVQSRYDALLARYSQAEAAGL